MTHAEFRERMGLGEFAIGLDLEQMMKPRRYYNFMNFEEEGEEPKD